MLFRDVDSPVTDFLFDDFKIARVLKARTKTQSGVEWSTDGEISPFRRGVKANIGVKYLNSNGLSLENLSASADGRYIAEGSLVAGDDLKLVVRADNGSHEPGKLFYSSAKLGFEYRVPQLAFSSNIDIVNGPIVQYDVLWTRNHFYVGAEGRWNSKHSRNRSLLKCLEMNIGARYDGPDWMSYVKSTNRFSSLQFAYLHYVSPVLSLGGMVDFKFKGNIQNVIFGTKFILDEQQRVILKAKIDSNGVLAFSLFQRILPHSGLTISHQVNVEDAAQSNSHKFGFCLTFD